MRKLRVALWIIFFLLLSPAAVQAQDRREITVSAALSLRSAFEEIGKAFAARHKNFTVLFNFGASGDLAAQIKGGAPVDVFASAAARDMDDLDRDGYVLTETKVNFTSNAVVLIVPVASKTEITSFDALAGPDVKKIAVGNPKTVPIGRYADEVLQYLKISGAVKDKLIFTENVLQVLDYVVRGEVDAGVVFATEAMVRPKEVRVAATAPAGSHRPVVYPIALVKGTRQEKAAKDFIRLVTSEEGKKILATYGFRPAP